MSAETLDGSVSRPHKQAPGQFRPFLRPAQIFLSARLSLPIRTLEPLSFTTTTWRRRNDLSIEHTYELCCQDAGATLAGIDQGRLPVAKESLRALMHRLATRQPLDPTTARGKSVLRSEQLEALEGGAFELAEALAALGGSTEQGFERLRFATDLVRHLTTDSRRLECASLASRC